MTQQSVLDRVQRLHACYGDRPESATPDTSLAELVKCKDLYSQEPTHIAPFDISRLKVAKGTVRPQPALDLLRGEARRRLAEFRDTIEKSEEELEFERFRGDTFTP